MDLIIVESPTKAKALRGFLGRGYRVLASMGHVRDLPLKQLGVDVEHNFRPTYHQRKGARKTIARLREGAQEAAWHVTQAIKSVIKDKPLRRITFHEITPQAIQAALAAPGEMDMDLVNAQQARRVLDRLVGYQVSPVLWKAIRGRKGLSAGRVQTVALRLVVERDREIEAFVPQEYWTLDAELSKVDDEEHRFRARLFRIGKEPALSTNRRFAAEGKPDLKTKADALAIIEALEGADWRVLKVKKQRKTRRPYPPYTTSTLQQDGANRLGWPAAKTMRVAQELYEGVALPDEGTVGLITYMRTDSTHVAEPAQQEAREVIARFWGDVYLPQKPPTYKTKAKVAQEAHEAIRPTSPKRTPKDLRPHLTPDQAKLYELIWRRFIASQMKPAVYNVTTVDVATSRDGQDLPYLFRASGRELLFAGFLKVYEVQDERPSDEDGAAGQTLPPLKDGEPLVLHGLYPEQHFTKPPPHFTEASLIKEMEKQGIGRPSTYASIVRTILQREYVERQRKSLLATGLGFVVCDFLVAQFPDLFAMGFTAKMEDDLDGIARGERGWVETLRAFYTPFSEALGQAQETAQAQTISVPVGKSKNKAKGKATPTGETCPECGGTVLLRRGKYGRFRACANFPRCKWKAPVVVGTCPKCGGDLVERKGKRGLFWGCTNYPTCTHAQEPTKQAETGQ
jgi:DNA topoisomerase-1